MNPERVKDIISSPIMADVTYNGSQVYIEQLDEVNNTVNIHLLDKPENLLEVPLSNLIEL